MKVQENGQRDMGYRIAKRRTELGMSQEKMAESIGVNRNTVMRIENGEHSPRADRITAICEVLHMMPNELFGMNTLSETPDDPRLSQLQMALDHLPKEKQDTFFEMANVLARGLLAGNATIFEAGSKDATKT